MARCGAGILCLFFPEKRDGEMAVIIWFSNIVTSTVFKTHHRFPSLPKKFHSILEFLFLLMAGIKKEIAFRHSNNALLVFPLLKCKLFTGRGHLKCISAPSPTLWDTDSDKRGPINTMNQQTPTLTFN